MTHHVSDRYNLAEWANECFGTNLVEAGEKMDDIRVQESARAAKRISDRRKRLEEVDDVGGRPSQVDNVSEPSSRGSRATPDGSDLYGAGVDPGPGVVQEGESEPEAGYESCFVCICGKVVVWGDESCPGCPRQFAYEGNVVITVNRYNCVNCHTNPCRCAGVGG